MSRTNRNSRTARRSQQHNVNNEQLSMALSLIESIRTMFRLLNQQDLDNGVVREALMDMATEEDFWNVVRKVLPEAGEDAGIHIHVTEKHITEMHSHYHNDNHQPYRWGWPTITYSSGQPQGNDDYQLHDNPNGVTATLTGRSDPQSQIAGDVTIENEWMREAKSALAAFQDFEKRFVDTLDSAGV